MCLIEKCLSLRFRLKSKLAWFTLEGNFWFEKLQTTKFLRGRDDGWEKEKWKQCVLNQNKKTHLIITHNIMMMLIQNTAIHTLIFNATWFRSEKINHDILSNIYEMKMKTNLYIEEQHVCHGMVNCTCCFPSSTQRYGHCALGTHDTFFIILHEQIVMDCYDVALS